MKLIRSKKPVTDNLMLVDVKPASFSDEFRELRDQQDLMYLKGCRREVLLGRASALDFMPTKMEGVSVYTGMNAYRHLLTYVTGLISRTRGESQIVSQFKGAYGEWQNRAPGLAAEFNQLYSNIIHDNGLIRNNVTSDLKPAFYEACAHELSRQESIDTVLVVANVHKSGAKVDDATENIVRYLGNNRKGAAETIVFTHPDSTILQSVYSYFLRQKSKGRITSEIKTLPFEDAFDATLHLQWMDKVYVCLPMGRDPKADTKMLEEWRQKEVLGGKFIHLGGSTKQQRQSSGIWRDPELFHYVSPEEITKWQEARKAQNEDTITQGKKACKLCAEFRQDHKRPRHIDLRVLTTTPHPFLASQR